MATPYRPDDDNPGWVIPPPPGTGPQAGGQAAAPGYDPHGPAQAPTPAHGQAPHRPAPHGQAPHGSAPHGPDPYGSAPTGPSAAPGDRPPYDSEPYQAPIDARPYATGAGKKRVPTRALLIAGGALLTAVLVGVSAAAVVAANKREYTEVAEDRAGGGAPAPAEATSPSAGASGMMGRPTPRRTQTPEKTAKPSPERGGGGGSSRDEREGPPPIPATFIKDSRAGLAYPGKGSPWFRGDDFGAYRTSWTSYQKRRVSREPDYFAEIGAGRLPGDIDYSGAGSLRAATERLARRYLGDRGLYPEHNLSGVVSTARTVDGKRAWYYSAVLNFPQAKEEGWSWRSERMALLVVHMPGRRPGTMFTTIPDVLNTSIGTNAISAARVL